MSFQPLSVGSIGLSLAATKSRLFFKDFPMMDERLKRFSVWKNVFHLTLRSTIKYSSSLPKRMILTSVGSEFPPKSIMLPVMYSNGALTGCARLRPGTTKRTTLNIQVFPDHTCLCLV